MKETYRWWSAVYNNLEIFLGIVQESFIFRQISFQSSACSFTQARVSKSPLWDVLEYISEDKTMFVIMSTLKRSLFRPTASSINTTEWKKQLPSARTSFQTLSLCLQMLSTNWRCMLLSSPYPVEKLTPWFLSSFVASLIDDFDTFFDNVFQKLLHFETCNIF